MATKRQPSKQKRAAQNRSERAARAARTANAAASPSVSATRATPASGGSGRSLLSRLRAGSAGGAARPSGGSARVRGAALRPEQPPGYRAALSALLAAGAAVLLSAFALPYAVDAQGDVYTPASRVADFAVAALHAVEGEPDLDAAEVADGIEDWSPGARSETALKAFWPYSAAVVLPVIGAALGFQAVRKRSSSKVFTRAMYATLFGAVLTQVLLIIFIPVVVAMGVAMYQVRKAEAAAAAAGADDVIDVDEVGEADVDAEAEAEG